MDDEAAFLAAIEANPADATARLVFADWLQDRSDPRAECYRLGGRILQDRRGWLVNFCSGGIGSYIAGKRLAAQFGTDKLIHLFTDTRSEDEDLYRFLEESTAKTGGVLVKIADGRNLWQLFRDEGMIANTRADICSRKLKRDLARAWIKAQFQPGEATLCFGIDHSERHRFYGNGADRLGIRKQWEPYTAEAPLCQGEPMTKCEMLQECERDGIDPPRIYDEGFPHNNCNGICVKAGQAHFALLLAVRPGVFMSNALEEDAFRKDTGKDVAILRDRRGGVTKPLPMLEFKRQIESGERVVDPRDWGKGCQCFTPEDSE